MLEWLATPWAGAILGLIGLLGIPLGFLFYFKGKRSPAMAYQIREFGVIGGTAAKFPDELEIRFEDERVDRVTSTELFVWNSGNTTIDGGQIVITDPLRVEITAGEVLKASIARMSRAVNSPSVSEGLSPTKRNISFDYLDAGDGFVVQVVHSGPKGATSLGGTLKEIPGGVTRIGVLPSPRPVYVARTILTMMLVVIGCSLLLLGVLLPTIFDKYKDSVLLSPTDPTALRWAFIFFGIMYAIVPTAALWTQRRRHPSSLADPNEDIPFSSILVKMRQSYRSSQGG